MKMIAASIPVALLAFGLLACSQHSATAPTVDRPAAAPPAAETNTFGESRDEATGNAASARDAHYAAEPPAADSAAASGAAAESTQPK